MAEIIGGIAVEITGDQTKLNAAIAASVQNAKAGGEKIAAAIGGASGSADALTAAVNRLTSANLAFMDAGTRALQQVQQSAPGYQAAQEQLAALNEELRAAQSQYEAAASAQATGAGAFQTATAATAELTAATVASAGAFEAQARSAAAASAAVAGGGGATGAVGAAAVRNISNPSGGGDITTDEARSLSAANALTAQSAAQDKLNDSVSASIAKNAAAAESQSVLAASATNTTGAMTREVVAEQTSTTAMGANANAAFQAAGGQQTLGTAAAGLGTAFMREAAAANVAAGGIKASAAASAGAAAATQAHAAAVGHAVTEVQAMGGAIRVFEGKGALKAVEVFLAKTLGLGPAMQAIFPIIGAIAFIEILGHMGEKIYEMFHKSQNAQEQLQGESRSLLATLQSENDSLQVTNDKLDNQIAKLTGKKPNMLKLMLDEAKESADKLAESLAKDGKALFDFLKQNQPGFFAKMFGTAGTEDIAKRQGGNTGAGGTNAEVAKIQESGRFWLDQVKSVNDKNVIIRDTNQKIAEAYDKQIQIEKDNLVKAQKEAEIRKAAPIQLGGSPSLNPSPGTKDTQTREELLRTRIRDLEAQKQKSFLTTESEPKKDQVAGLQEAKSQAEEWMKIQQEALTKIKTEEGEFFTPRMERAFWAERISTAIAGGKTYESARIAIENDIARLTREIATKERSAEAHDVELQKKEFESMLKEKMNAAEQANVETPTPKAAGLRFAQETLAKPEVNQGEFEAARDKLHELWVQADHESKQLLNKMLKDSDEAFAEAGEHTAAEMSSYYGRMIAILEQTAGAEDELAEYRKKKRSSDKGVEAQVTRTQYQDVGLKEQQANAGVTAAKTTITAQYESQITHSVEEQLTQRKQIAALDLISLENKRQAAAEEFEIALAKKDGVKADEAADKWIKADNEISQKRLETEVEIAKIAREGNAAYQIQSGLMKDIQSGADNLASRFAHAVVEGKGIGTAVKESLKGLEADALTTVMKTITGQMVNAAKGVLTNITGGIGGAIGGALGKIGLGGPDPKVSAEIANTTSINLLTASNRALLAALTGNTGATTANTGATGANTGSTVANTGAVFANTAATIAKTIKDAVVGAAKTVGGLLGGAAKESVTSTISFGNTATQVAAETANTTVVAANTAATTAVAASNTVIATELAAQTISDGANTAAMIGLTAAIIDLTSATLATGFLPFAAGGRPPVGVPSIVGERGKELFIPDEAGTIIPADQTDKLLRGAYSAPQVPQGAPEVPAGAGGISASVSASGADNSVSTVNNHNTGFSGTAHFNIYESRNPRQTVREISQFMKLQNSKFSPANN